MGGTTLNLSGNAYISESGWSDGGGGQSQYESQPSFQNAVNSSGYRQIPNVLPRCRSRHGRGRVRFLFGGNSQRAVGASRRHQRFVPLLGGLDSHCRSAPRLPDPVPRSLDGPSQTLPALYGINAADFHDITSGSNGSYSAGLGYDMVTGLGSPIANQLVPDLALYPAGRVSNPATTVSLAASTNAPQYSQPITFDVTVGESNVGALRPRARSRSRRGAR